MTKIARDYTAKAVAIVNAGSAIKSKIKEANEDLARAYAEKREVIMNACLDTFAAVRGDRPYDAAIEAEINETGANKLYWAMPDFHNFKAKHAAMIREVFAAEHDAVIAAIEDLVALRAELKAVEVVKFEKKETIEDKIKTAVLKGFEDTIADRRAQFNWASEIIRALNENLPYEAGKGLFAPVSVQPVYCRNYFGTAWVRIDWYFRGEKMAFNVIMAAVGAIADEKKGK